MKAVGRHRAAHRAAAAAIGARPSGPYGFHAEAFRRILGPLGEADLLVAVRDGGAGSVRINRLQTAAFLCGRVVHDLDNLLNTLAMHAELGRERAEASPLAATHFDRIRAASRQATELTGLLRRYMRDDATSG